MAGVKLFIATPLTSVRQYLALDDVLHRRTVADGKDIFLASVEALIASQAINFTFRALPGLAPVGFARNRAVTEFLKTDCTDLLFIDSDIGFTPDDARRIAQQDAEVVGGLYPLKQDHETRIVVSLYPGEEINQANGLQRVSGIGTGFLKIARSVFEKLQPHVESYTNELGETEYDFFRHGVQDGKYFGEDIAFCLLCRKHEIAVHADWGILLDHQGYDSQGNSKIFRCSPGNQTQPTNHIT